MCTIANATNNRPIILEHFEHIKLLQVISVRKHITEILGT